MKIGVWYKDELVFETEKDNDFNIEDIEIMESEDGQRWENPDLSVAKEEGGV